MLPPGFEILKDSYWIKHNSQQLSYKYFYVYIYEVETFKEQQKKTNLNIRNTGTSGGHSPKDATHGAMKTVITFLSIRLWTLTLGNCYREEQNLTPCWMIYFTLRFLLVCLLQWYCPYTMACLRKPCPSAFVQDLPTCGWLDEGRK